jgi:hypothetical protein
MRWWVNVLAAFAAIVAAVAFAVRQAPNYTVDAHGRIAFTDLSRSDIPLPAAVVQGWGFGWTTQMQQLLLVFFLFFFFFFFGFFLFFFPRPLNLWVRGWQCSWRLSRAGCGR